MDFSTLLILGLAAIVVIAVFTYINASNRQEAMQSTLNTLPDFKPTQQYIGPNGHSGLAIDSTRNKVCLISNSGPTVSYRVISYKEILSVELVEDGNSVTRTLRTSQIGSALVGGVLLGGVGAIVGGLSGKTRTTGNVTSVDLRLIVNDTSAPLHNINFMNIEGKRDGLIYPTAIKAARHWHGVIEVIIKQGEAEEQALQAVAVTTQAALPPPSLADELRKLADLRDCGVLTPEEFQEQKSKMLGTGITS